MSGNGPKDQGNYISEWFGHRVFPMVSPDVHALADQKGSRCPFLSLAKGSEQKCIKRPPSKGVCTVSSASNGVRQDWLVCPWRGLSPELLSAAVHRLFALPEASILFTIPAIRLTDAVLRADVALRLKKGERVFIYFDAKLSGELSIPPTDKSPEFSFDVTIFEIVLKEAVPHIGRFAVLEIQTMDFHGSYKTAVQNLTEGLRLHGAKFAATLQENQHWLAEDVEGPNIANVFKRTFYQMMFKFQLARHDKCAGCVLAIPLSVWDSWQRHLASAELIPESDGTYSLFKPGQSRPEHSPAWIYVFDVDAKAKVSPKPLRFDRIIATDAASVSYFALEEAPHAAISNIEAADGLFGLAARRIKQLWPELASTITF